MFKWIFLHLQLIINVISGVSNKIEDDSESNCIQNCVVLNLNVSLFSFR